LKVYTEDSGFNHDGRVLQHSCQIDGKKSLTPASTPSARLILPQKHLARLLKG